MLNRILDAMEKTGSMSFDDEYEKYAFAKIAQDMIDPVTVQMMAQSAGMPLPQDPSMVMQPQVPMPGMMPQQAPAMAQGAEVPMGSQLSPEETMVGESITNKDIESLVKIINVLTALKSKYDGIKKDQMAILNDKTNINEQGPQ